MKTIISLFLVASCASGPQNSPTLPKEEIEMVTVETTLEHIFQSYVLGCVEALKKAGQRQVYSLCQDRGRKHANAVRLMLTTPTQH